MLFKGSTYKNSKSCFGPGMIPTNINFEISIAQIEADSALASELLQQSIQSAYKD